MNWVLIIYIYAGILANGDSVALTTISNFTTKQECMQAGNNAKDLVSGSTKVYKYVCVSKEKNDRLF